MADCVLYQNVTTNRLIRYINLTPSTSGISADLPLDGAVTWPRRRSGSFDLPRNVSATPRFKQRSACRLAKLHICASQAQPQMQFSTAPAPASVAPRAQPGPGWMLTVLVCATLTALAGAFTVFMVYMRPVLQRMEKAALATETASKAMERSAKEFEQTNLMFQEDCPSMIAEIEASAREYRELGQTLNLMTAGFRGKNPVKDWSQQGMQRVAKDVSALTSALSPAMDQWRKRISKIATSFEHSHKADPSKPLKATPNAAPDQALPAQAQAAISTEANTSGASHDTSLAADLGAKDQATVKDSEQADQALAPASTSVEEAGKSLTNAAISLRSSRDQSRKASSKKQLKDRRAESATVEPPVLSTQEALNMLDVDHARAGAVEINEAAAAAERVTSDVSQLVANLAKESQDSDAVEEIFEQSAASQDLPDMSEEEQALLAQLRSKKQAAESVFKALQRAEDAATAAATASGALEQAMQAAESQGVLSSNDDLPESSLKGKKEGSGGKRKEAQATSKRRQASSAEGSQHVACGNSPAQMDSSPSDT